MLGARRAERDTPAIGCTLSAHKIGGRLAQWEAIAAIATGRISIDAGTRLTFDHGVDIPVISALFAAEQNCCRFLTFTLTVTADHVALAITGPSGAQPVVDALIGAAR